MEKIGNSINGISILKDPFKKDCVTEVMLKIATSCFSPYEKYCYAYVEFKNGNTTGKQNFPRCNDFNKLTKDVQAFIETLTND